ncbi:MAG TPA: hypothetical protein VLG69_01100 [Candidatus Andersenbacteria bacterium]|nr:hypothetical protein [Candidatus Andersenbacteria bacterium]
MDEIISNLEGSLEVIQFGMIRVKNSLVREENPTKRELQINELLSLIINMELLTKAIRELKQTRDYVK